jgi:hypothetical protein
MVETILQEFGLNTVDFLVRPFGSGLIHHTYLVNRKDSDEAYILQRVNQHVFKKPGDIAHNIRVIGNYLKSQHPEYLFTIPVLTRSGEDYALTGDGFYRLFDFIRETHTVDVCQSPEQAFEAARQFGKFTAILSGLKIDMLRYTIPGFHDLAFRYRQFLDAIQNGNKSRIDECSNQIDFITSHKIIVDQFEMIRKNPQFILRVTHHDTKINNVLLNAEEKGVCVIDLDTVMPGYFISDVGDMMRTYLSPANEEEKDYDKVFIRKNYFEAIVNGYLSEMKNELTSDEKANLIYAGKFMIYMQAIRFLTDYLNNDIYYGAQYEGHNFVRAVNQITLLQKLEEKEPELTEMADRFL